MSILILATLSVYLIPTWWIEGACEATDAVWGFGPGSWGI